MGDADGPGARTATDAAVAGRVLPGLFPPPPSDLDATVRRVFIGVLVVLAAGGGAVQLALSRDQQLLVPLALVLGGGIVSASVPWHRYPRDAFGVVGIAAIAWVAWITALTGGAVSPFVPLTFLVVALCAIPLSRVIGTVLGCIAAAAASLPLVYQDLALRDAQELLIRTVVLIVAATFAPWLMEEVRRASQLARAERQRVASVQEVTSELQRTQNARQEYLSVLAHELRNPLNAINAAARMLAKDISGTENEATAHAIATEAHHAMELLDGLTDVASLEAGRMRLALRPIDLSSVLRETANAAANGHRIALRGADQALTVLGDDRRLGQVIRNLVSNAAKYSPEEAEIQVSLGISADRRTAIVQVRDQGPGIPPTERGRLFQKFARLSTAGGTRGSGLGLFISRGIVNDHGGELWADWPAGGGSVFSFSVPLTGERAATGDS